MDLAGFHKRHRNLILRLLGTLFSAWGAAAIFVSFSEGNFDQIFWSCYIGLLLIGVGILSLNSRLIGSQLSILAIPLILWNIDFISYLIFRDTLFGVTDYLFLSQRLLVSNIISLQHLFTLPLALYTMYLIGVKRTDFWKISVMQMTFLYFIVFLNTNPEQNISCVFSPCLNIELGLPYTLTWFLVSFAIIFLTNFLLAEIPFIKKGKNEK